MHLKRTDKKGQHWNILEESDIWAVNDNQIIARNIDVIYHGASLNRIEISKAIVKSVTESVQEIQKCLDMD